MWWVNGQQRKKRDIKREKEKDKTKRETAADEKKGQSPDNKKRVRATFYNSFAKNIFT